MIRCIFLILTTFLFFQCGNSKVKVDDGSDATPIETKNAPVKNLATQNDSKTFRLERKSPAAKSPKTTAKSPNMTGYFRYAADAALFIPCGEEKGMPIVMEGDYLKMEKAYLRIENLEFAEKVYAKVIATKKNRKDMEGKEKPHLVISEFLGFERGKKCN